jgi:hypothetical protein
MRSSYLSLLANLILISILVSVLEMSCYKPRLLKQMKFQSLRPKLIFSLSKNKMVRPTKNLPMIILLEV